MKTIIISFLTGLLFFLGIGIGIYFLLRRLWTNVVGALGGLGDVLNLGNKDKECVEKYGPGAFWDIGLAKCYKCPPGMTRDHLVPINQSGSCINKQDTVKIYKDPMPTCKEEYENKMTIQDGKEIQCGPVFMGANKRCHCCPRGFLEDTLKPYNSHAKCFKNNDPQFKPAAVLREGTAPDGFNACTNGYQNWGNKCYKCPSGYSKKTLLWSDPNPCRKKTFIKAYIKPVQSCTQQYANKSTRDSNGKAIACGGSAGYGEGSCWCCPKGSDKVALHAWSAPDACQKGGLFGETVRAYKIRSGTFPDGFPALDSGWKKDALTNNQYKCPSGWTEDLALTIDDPSKCFKESTVSAKTYPIQSCKEQYAGKTVTADGKQITCDLDATGWDPIGKCFCCPKGFKRSTDPVTGSRACKKDIPPTRKPAHNLRSGNPPAGRAAPPCPSDLTWNTDGYCWTCPAGYKDDGLVLDIKSPQKCFKVDAGIELGGLEKA